MGRKRSSFAEDLMDVIALLPWWAGVLIAFVVYLVLHAFAVPPALPSGSTPHAALGLAPRIVFAQVAAIMQYVIPVICLLGSALSFIRRRRRAALIQDVSERRGAALDAMSWRDFEATVGEAFRLRGYSVAENGGGGPDGGIDLILRRDGRTYLVQCKQRRAGNVDVPTVRELAGVLADRRAHGAFIVTSGQFTPAAEEFAARNQIELMNRERLLAQVPVRRPSVPVAAPPSTESPSPSCPKCSSVMVKRQARTGANEGSYFWGCSTFPKCRGTVATQGPR
jgi:restriction system protein